MKSKKARDRSRVRIYNQLTYLPHNVTGQTIPKNTIVIIAPGGFMVSIELISDVLFANALEAVAAEMSDRPVLMLDRLGQMMEEHERAAGMLPASLVD